MTLAVTVGYEDAFEPDFLAMQLRNRILRILVRWNANACSHISVGLEEDRHMEDGDVLAEDVGDHLLHLSLVDVLIQIAHLELHRLCRTVILEFENIV